MDHFDIRAASLPYIPHGRFGLFTGYIFTINSIIGAGFLSIPWAFSNAGWLFTLLFHTFSTIQTYIFAIQMLELMSRAEVLIRMTEDAKDIHGVSLMKLFNTPVHNENLIQPSHLTPIITNRLINCPDIVKLVFGQKAGFIYLISMCLSQFGGMVAYAAIFSSSFASIIPLGTQDTCDIYTTDGFYNDCRWKYWVFLLLFTLMTVYMTVIGMEEQQYVQIAMSVLRFLVMFAILFTCIANIALSKNNDNDHYNKSKWPPLVVPENIGHAIPIILFAMSYQVQIPTISEPINNKVRNLPLTNILSIITCFIFYGLIGILGSLAIHNVPSLVSLSYRDYTAGHTPDSRPGWTYIIEYLIIVSPALDVLFSFPMKALSISDSILTWVKGGNIEEIPKRLLVSARFLTALSSSVIAFFFYDLGGILDWVGLLGIPVVQIMFPLLHIGMRHLVTGKSPYDINIPLAVNWAIIISNIGIFVVVAWEIIA